MAGGHCPPAGAQASAPLFSGVMQKLPFFEFQYEYCDKKGCQDG